MGGTVCIQAWRWEQACPIHLEKPIRGPEQRFPCLPERPRPHGEQAALRKGPMGSWVLVLTLTLRPSRTLARSLPLSELSFSITQSVVEPRAFSCPREIVSNGNNLYSNNNVNNNNNSITGF